MAQTPGAAIPGPTPMAVPIPSQASLDGIMVLFAERDRQYQQRFDSQEKAAAIAFAAQEKAVAAALAANKEATAAAFAAAKEAVDKAEIANQKHFDSVNEFRKTLTDQSGLFATKNELDLRVKAITDKLEDLTKRQDNAAGRGEGANWLLSVMIAVAGLVIAVAVVFVGRQRRLAPR
jgi:Flp pilus assembly protein TadB